MALTFFAARDYISISCGKYTNDTDVKLTFTKCLSVRRSFFLILFGDFNSPVENFPGKIDRIFDLLRRRFETTLGAHQNW